MAYNNRGSYRSYDRKIHVNKKFRNRVIIIATGIVIFALIVALISCIFSCVCTGSTKTDPTINTATLGTGTSANAKTKAKAKPTDSITFKEPDIKDDDTESVGVLDGEVYVWNSKAFAAFNGTKENAKAYADYINEVKSTLGNGVNVYSSIFPTHIETGLPNRMKNTDEGISTKSQADYIKAAYKKYDKKVKYINTYNEFSTHCNDYIFFDSDYNPTALGGFCVYKSFVDTTKKSKIALSSCKEAAVQNFTGYYNDTTDSELGVDMITYWDFPYSINNTITTADGETFTAESVYNKDAESGASAYDVFLYGKNPLEVIKSESDKASGKIAIIHNKTGNSSVPYFTYNYEEVYSIDYTQYNGNLKNLCEENGITDVLFISDTDSSADSDQLASLQKLLSTETDTDTDTDTGEDSDSNSDYDTDTDTDYDAEAE